MQRGISDAVNMNVGNEFIFTVEKLKSTSTNFN